MAQVKQALKVEGAPAFADLVGVECERIDENTRGGSYHTYDRDRRYWMEGNPSPYERMVGAIDRDPSCSYGRDF
jgi:hypothetical protein